MASVVIGSEDGKSRARLVAARSMSFPRFISLLALSVSMSWPVVASVVIGSEDGERPLLVASVGRVFHILSRVFGL